MDEKIKVFEDIIEHHQNFLNNCFEEAMLMDEKIRNIILKL